MKNIYATATKALQRAYQNWQRQQRLREQFTAYHERQRLGAFFCFIELL